MSDLELYLERMGRNFNFWMNNEPLKDTRILLGFKRVSITCAGTLECSVSKFRDCKLNVYAGDSTEDQDMESLYCGGVFIFVVHFKHGKLNYVDGCDPNLDPNGCDEDLE